MTPWSDSTVSVIRTEKLTKFYGADRGIIDLDLTVEAGEVFGFLGPNGAGKSTTIRLLLDLIRPSSRPDRALRSPSRDAPSSCAAVIGYLPGDLRLYENLSARETLRLLRRRFAG